MTASLDGQSLNIVYNSDENFTEYTAVSIASLFSSSKKGEAIRVFILGYGISKKTVKNLESLAKEENQSVNVISMDDFGKTMKLLFGNDMNTGRFSTVALARIFAPSMLPDDVEKYLYLDGDTIVRKDIRELYETKIQTEKGFAAAAVCEPTIYEQSRKMAGLSDEDMYFNSGVILVDRKAWENEKITSKCIDYFKKTGGKLAFADQDILNGVLKGKMQALGQQYNFFSNYNYFSYGPLCKKSPWFKNFVSENEYNAAKKDPCIVHFAGDERPWLKGNFNPYRNEYRKALFSIDWTKKEEKKGKEAYLFLYHIMNLLTVICPWARNIISEYYGKKRINEV